MKRLNSSDTFGEGGNFLVPLEGMEDEECGEEMMGIGGGGGGEKKRRLSVEQVRALERSFELENKLEPEKKTKLAQELGLQPRQVAVWFQNRRARWKTKQLERDHAALRGSYDSLKHKVDSLNRENQALLAEIEVLKAKLAGVESFSSVKEEPVVSESENKPDELPALIYKDGSSESDSSAVLTDETSPPNQGISSSTTSLLIPQQEELVVMGFNNSCTHKEGFFYQPQLPKMEDNTFLAEDEPCSSFFSDEQAPTLSWYSDQWS